MSSNLKVFQKSIEGVGTFCLRYPTVKDTIEIGRLRSEKYLHGVRYEWDSAAQKDVPLGLDNTTLFIATAYCELIVCTVKKPDDFDYDKCDDLSMVLDLHDAFDKWRLDFRKDETTPPDKEDTEQTA
jgi:hypothetical protein